MVSGLSLQGTASLTSPHVASWRAVHQYGTRVKSLGCSIRQCHHHNRARIVCHAENSSMKGMPNVATSTNIASGSGSKQRVLQTDPIQLAELLVQLSSLQVKPHQQWLQDVLDTMQPRLQELNAEQLSSTLRVLGSWGYSPPEPFMQQLHAAMQQQMHSLSMRHIADMTWGLAQLQNPKQPMLDELLQAASSLMLHCTVQQADAKHHEQQKATLVCPSSLADLVWSIAKHQHSPGEAWLARFASTSQPILNRFTPHELAQVIWAFARLPFAPSQAWMEAFLEAVRQQLRDFDSKSVSLTAWGLATLKARPTTRWLFAFERQAERTLSTLAASELACTLWALSELKAKRPHELRLGRLVRRQEVFYGFDFEALANPRLLRVVRQLTLGPQRGS